MTCVGHVVNILILSPQAGECMIIILSLDILVLKLTLYRDLVETSTS